MVPCTSFENGIQPHWTHVYQSKYKYHMQSRSKLNSTFHFFHNRSLPAYIFEITGSYQDAFFVAGAAIAAGSCTLPFTRLFMPDLETGRERKEIGEETSGKEQTAHGSAKANEVATGEEQRNSCV